MTQQEKRVWLIQELQKEKNELSDYIIPKDEQSQKNLLRALMNIWIPKKPDKRFIEIQDEYLTKENYSSKITGIEDLTPIENESRLFLWQGDMTTLNVDAIVNPANSRMMGCFRILHNCADNIIHSKAGIELRYKCYEIMKSQGHEEPTGLAKITPGYNLPCKYILHTVGPVVTGNLTEKHKKLLSSCYLSCLKLADENNIKSIAFCCISTGVFMFPNRDAAEIAVDTVKKYLDDTKSQIKVIFNVYKDIDLEIYKNILMKTEGRTCNDK